MTQTRESMKEACVIDIIKAMEGIAPPELAEEWDNCGLQAGSLQWPVRSLWVSLDPHPEVIAAAARQGVDMVITHHPLLFQPMRCIDTDSPVGAVLQTALSSRIAVYAAHTNLDSALGGVNDLLAQRVGLTDTIALIPSESTGPDDQRTGMGRIGQLPEAMPLEQLARRLKKDLGLAVVKTCGDPKMSIQRVALCSGSGSGLLNDFMLSDAQVYVSGDLRYHDARSVIDEGRALIDVGHFASEQIMIDVVADRLRHALRRAGWSTAVSACRMEQDPFQYF